MDFFYLKNIDCQNRFAWNVQIEFWTQTENELKYLVGENCENSPQK